MSGVLKSGERFGGRYVVETLIAEGGMASIYRALDEHTGRHVAVKVLYPYYSENEVIRARFVEEGNIQKSLGHPNVVHVHDVVLDPLAIVMEHVEGPTLDDYLAQQGQLDEDDVLDIIIPVMSALGLAHSRGIIHRDLKPSNILLNRLRRGFQPKVMDFGVAKVKDAKHNLTATGTTVGTLHYMSPEQIVGSKTIDGRADIYSLGVTLFKLVTGEVPFNAPTEFALMMAQVEASPLPPSKLRPGLSPELEAIILRAMAKKPIERFQTIREFTTALLNMRRGKEQTVRDTLTETISQELIDFALAADEVAKDRTAEMSFDVIRATLMENEDSLEATVEMTANLGLASAPRLDWAGASGEATVELTSHDVMRLSTLDGDRTADDSVQMIDKTAETEVMARRTAEELRSTRPSGASAPLPGTASLVSESVETNSMAQRLRRGAEQVVVLDQDVDSRDMTAPKVRERDYERAVAALPRPSGPKVVLGYNPADTQDKTYEKPNMRTRLPQFETSKSDENPIRKLRREPPMPPRPGPRVEGPPPPPPGHGSAPSSSSSVLERIDVAAQSAMQLARQHNLPPWLVFVCVFSVFVIVGSVVWIFAHWLFS